MLDWNIFDLNCINMTTFHQPEFVCRSSETQIQVVENLNYVIQFF